MEHLIIIIIIDRNGWNLVSQSKILHQFWFASVLAMLVMCCHLSNTVFTAPNYLQLAEMAIFVSVESVGSFG